MQLEQLGGTKIFCDNNSTIRLSKNLVLHRRTKHIDMRFYFLRDLGDDGVINLMYCKSEDQIADKFIKALKREAFVKLKKWLGVCIVKPLN